MKKLFVGILAFTSVSAQANANKALELTKFAVENVSVSSARKNIDKSVTFQKISVIRGDQTFEIDASKTTFNSVCKMLGYENSLTGANLNSTSYFSSGYWTLVALNSNGQYVDTIRSDKKMEKVTCFNKSELMPAVDFTKTDNADGSVKITNISYSRGDQSFEIDASKTTFKSVCKMIGYENSLTGANLNSTSYFSSGYWTLVALNSDGQYVDTIRSDKKIEKVTCFSGAEPELIILIDGTRYRHQPLR